MSDEQAEMERANAEFEAFLDWCIERESEADEQAWEHWMGTPEAERIERTEAWKERQR